MKSIKSYVILFSVSCLLLYLYRTIFTNQIGDAFASDVKIVERKETFRSRPLLIFNHNPKAGGSSVLKVMQELKPNAVICKNDKMDSCESHISKAAQFDKETVDKTFVYVREFRKTSIGDRRKGFIIGSIREPCSQYLSLWAYGSNDHGSLRIHGNVSAELYGVDKPLFNTPSDKKRFWAWMRDPNVDGLIGNRTKDSYGESVFSSADCFVFAEDFTGTLLRCLRMYEDQGGFVDWKTQSVAAMLKEEGDPYKRRQNRRTTTQNKGSHGGCEEMFDEPTAKLVREGRESFIYESFGYEACCKAGTKLPIALELAS
jgi:hypothetical protein